MYADTAHIGTIHCASLVELIWCLHRFYTAHIWL